MSIKQSRAHPGDESTVDTAAKRLKQTLETESDAGTSPENADTASTAPADKAETSANDSNAVNYEAEVGIVRYRSPEITGFSAILKHLYSDFVVQEVSLDNQVVVLQQVGIPPHPDTISKTNDAETAAKSAEPAPTAEPAAPSPTAATTNAPTPSPLDPVTATTTAPVEREEQASEPPTDEAKVASLSAWLSADEQTQLLALLAKSAADCKQEEVRVTKEMDKGTRTALHQAIKTHFPRVLNSTAVDGQVAIRRGKDSDDRRGGIAPRRGDPTSRDDARSNGSAYSGRLAKVPGQGRVCAFTLCKENRDTMDCIQLLTKMVRTNARSFAYAGTKDRRGVTTQRVTCQGVSPYRLAQLNSRLRGARIGDFMYQEQPLKLGKLYGNRFIVTLRDITADQASVDRMVQQWTQHGFLNYFGLQRFGSNSIKTHQIGIALLKSDWKQAIDLLLLPRPGDRADVHLARQTWQETSDATKAQALFPTFCHAERQILSHLAKGTNQNDFSGALRVIPHHLKSMYLHAYQSYVWNNAVNHRLDTYGTDGLVAGDLVLVPKKSEAQPEANGTTDASTPLAYQASEDMQVKVYDPDTMANDGFTLNDLVLPLPGFDVTYPTNSVGQFIQDFMARDGLDPQSMERNVRAYSLPGSYRKVFGCPEKVEFKWLRYSSPNQPLIDTDLDRTADSYTPLELATEGPFLALQLGFTLRSSQYATMCIRELMHTSTSPRHHSQLSGTHIST